MSKIISVHSFRGGTGKSNTTANIAALLAMDGARVGVVDTDIASPECMFFLISMKTIWSTLSTIICGKRTIEEAAQDVTGHVGGEIKGDIFLDPFQHQSQRNRPHSAKVTTLVCSMTAFAM